MQRSQVIKHLFRKQIVRRRIDRYRHSLGPEEEFKVIFGGHWSDHTGWLVLTEAEQDITNLLEFAEESVDVVFTEHVLEHVSFLDGVAFIGEARRILRTGGVFRVVCPVTEKLLSFSLDDEKGKEYLRCLERFYPEERKLFYDLKFDVLMDFNTVFLLNSIFTGYGHRFIWSAKLLARVITALGYSEVQVYDVGQGSKSDYCIERRRRGLYLGNNWEEDRAAEYVFDAESMAVEAIK